MLARASRLLKHRWHDERGFARRLGPEGLKRLEERIAAAERGTSGEVRLCVEAGLPWSYIRRGASPRERAVAMFSKLGVWDTERNNGVLLYVLLAEHCIEVVADRGIDRAVDPGRWKAIADALAADLAAGAAEEGLGRAIDAIGAILREHFPGDPGVADRNELPDAPVLR